MKDFTLRLDGCSKADRKKVIKLVKSVGYEWRDKNRFKDNEWPLLRISDSDMHYDFYMHEVCIPIYQMPRDWDKIQEALGVEVEPKDGEVWFLRSRFGSSILRAELRGGFSDSYSMIENNRSLFGASKCFKDEALEYRKATPEETTKLIEAEHANGFHWDGKELVKIPEYVEYFGVIYPVNKEKPTIYGRMWNIPERFKGVPIDDCNISTKEAFEAQEAKEKQRLYLLNQIKKAGLESINNTINSNKQFEKQMKDVKLITENAELNKENSRQEERIERLISSKFELVKKMNSIADENAELKQTIKTLSHTSDILAQENAELIKKLYKIKGML